MNHIYEDTEFLAETGKIVMADLNTITALSKLSLKVCTEDDHGEGQIWGQAVKIHRTSI